MNKSENLLECPSFRHPLLGKGGKRGKDAKKPDRGEAPALPAGEGRGQPGSELTVCAASSWEGSGEKAKLLLTQI